MVWAILILAIIIIVSVLIGKSNEAKKKGSLTKEQIRINRLNEYNKNIQEIKKNAKERSQVISHDTDLILEGELNPEISITINKNKYKFDEIVGNKNSGWIINPNASLELTVLCENISIAEEVRQVLDDESIYFGEKRSKLIRLFAEYNIKIKEIEDYKSKYQKIYFDNLNKLKQTSEEWKLSGEKDKEDLLIEFRKLSLEKLPFHPGCDLETLFEFEPADITLDNVLIKEYGFDNMQTYLNYYRDIGKIHIIPADDYYRPSFEKLINLNLAERCTNLDYKEIIMTMTLKELNLIADNPEKIYKRKNQAVEYISTLPNLDEILSKHISYRELFKILPLPDKYNDIDIKAISNIWNYHSQEASILINTYKSTLDYMVELSDLSHLKSFSISTRWFSNQCPCCQEFEDKDYPINRVPKLPHHIGCGCYLVRNNDYQSMRNFRN